MSGLSGALLVALLLALAGCAGVNVARTATTASVGPPAAQASSKSSPSASASPSAQQRYLVIPELGIRFTLSADIQSAYYRVKPSTRNGKPGIALYAHALDSYPLCTPAKNNGAIAYLVTFVPGATDPVYGVISSTYPNAPLIGGLHYIIVPGQFDCTEGKNPHLLTTIVRSFDAAYQTIEAYPAN